MSDDLYMRSCYNHGYIVSHSAFLVDDSVEEEKLDLDLQLSFQPHNVPFSVSFFILDGKLKNGCEENFIQINSTDPICQNRIKDNDQARIHALLENTNPIVSVRLKTQRNTEKLGHDQGFLLCYDG